MGVRVGAGGNAVSGSADPRRTVVEALAARGGVIVRAAHDLGIHRKTLWRYVTAWGLWPAVNQMRRERQQAARRRRK